MSGSPNRTPCNVTDCPNSARRRGLCWTHLKREKRGIPLTRELRPYGLTKEELRGRAATRYAEAEDPLEYKRAAKLISRYAENARRKEVAAIVRQTVDEVMRRLGKRR